MWPGRRDDRRSPTIRPASPSIAKLIDRPSRLPIARPSSSFAGASPRPTRITPSSAKSSASEARGASAPRWIVDPIDGTNTFIRGVPFYGVLVALEIDGGRSVGVVLLPCARRDDRGGARPRLPLERPAGSASRVYRTLAEATLVYTDARNIEARLGEQWSALQQRHGLTTRMGRLLRPLPCRDGPRRRHARSADESVGLRRADADPA